MESTVKEKKSKISTYENFAKGWKDIMNQLQKELEKTPWWKLKEVAAIRSNHRYAQYRYMDCIKKIQKEMKNKKYGGL